MILSLRLLGYAVIFLCPAVVGIFIGKRTEETVQRLEGVILLIEHIKYEIGERMTPQNELFVRFGNSALERCGFLETLKKCRSDGEKSALANALEMYGDLFFDDKRCNMMLSDFAESLGKLPCGVQMARCESYLERFGSIYAEKSVKAQSDIKLCRSMGILCGAAAVLMVL